jgi:hypothetical protein
MEGMSGGERNPFDPKVIAAMIAAGILAFTAFFVLAAYAPEYHRGQDGRAHALSVSAVGFQGIVQLIGLAGGKTDLIRAADGRDTEDLLVATLEPFMDSAAVEKLIAQRQGKATLLILPKWQVLGDPRHKGWVRSIGLAGPMAATPLRLDGKWSLRQGTTRTGVAAGRGLLEGVDVPLPRLVQVIRGEKIEPLIATRNGLAILARYGEGPLYILADPDLLNNQGLKDPARAKAALAILNALNSTGAETISFDVALNGFGARRNALKLAFEPPFLALTIAIFVAALLAGLHGAFRFGPAAREGRAIAFGKAALVENSAGLFRIARREHRTGSAYAELIREEAAYASGAQGLRGAELDAYLDRFSSADRPNFSALAAEAAEAPDRHHLVSAARALFLWKKDLIQ